MSFRVGNYHNLFTKFNFEGSLIKIDFWIIYNDVLINVLPFRHQNDNACTFYSYKNESHSFKILFMENDNCLSMLNTKLHNKT